MIAHICLAYMLMLCLVKLCISYMTYVVYCDIPQYHCETNHIVGIMITRVPVNASIGHFKKISALQGWHKEHKANFGFIQLNDAKSIILSIATVRQVSKECFKDSKMEMQTFEHVSHC